MANFYVYCISVQRFQDFIRSDMLSVKRCFRVRGRHFLVSLRLPQVSIEDRRDATRGLKTTAVSNVKPGSQEINAISILK